MKADLIIHNIKKLYTPFHQPPIKGAKMHDILEVDDCFIAIKNGNILHIGKEDIASFSNEETIFHDAKNKICLPGFIDGHSHLVHGGSREDEFALLRSGTPYLDILRAGGGILNTVKKTKESPFEALYDKAKKSLNIMMTYGVTTLETKSGYGLSLQHEIKQLEVAKTLKTHHPMHIYLTYMGAHAIPVQYKDRINTYVNQIKKDMEIIKQLDLAKSVDVFCEAHVFDVQNTKDMLLYAKSLGFDVRIHADEIHPLGGAGLGVELEAKSVDHLMAISDEDIIKLANSQTIANVLPGTSFYLDKAYAPARKMIDQGVALGIAGDYNPGSCPTENYQFILQLAANHMKLTSNEILTAATINPAYHLDCACEKGSLEVDKHADLILLDAPNLDFVFYHYGINHVTDVFIKGHHVVKNKLVIKEVV